MGRYLRIRLGAMMLLQFFIWGGWFVTMGSYLAANLAATGSQTALAYSTQSWGAIIAPFVIGLIADKYINAERLLGIIHLDDWTVPKAHWYEPLLATAAPTKAVSPKWRPLSEDHTRELL